MISAITITAIFLSGLVTTGQIGNVFSQTNESSNMTATSSNASSMEANITGSTANDTGMGAPHASNMTPEKVLLQTELLLVRKQINNPYGFFFFYIKHFFISVSISGKAFRSLRVLMVWMLYSGKKFGSRCTWSCS